MSNSGGKVVYAFSMDEEVGIDLEKIRELPDLDELIEKNYIASERDYINKLPEQRQHRFFQFWTIKEAYLKAIGVGMRIPPDNIAFSIQNGAYKLQSIHGVQLGFEKSDWIFNRFTLENNKYVGTLASKNQNANITLRSLV
jgi:4'-phosphopantetheinyl transferase